MKKCFYTIITFFALTFLSNTAKAQVIVTEFIRFGLDADINVKSKAFESVLNASTGIKDLDWHKESNTLSITFDPRKTTLEDILKKLAVATSPEVPTEKTVAR